MKAKTCDICETPMTSRVTTLEAPYAYVIGGLSRVGLVGITVHHCRACDVDAPMIPKPSELHQVLADLFVRKADPLAGDEVRFLRKHAGLPAQKFAALLGIDPSHLSRVENGKLESLGPSTDRLTRAIVLAAIGSETVRDVLLKEAEERLEPPRPLRRPLVKMERNRWKVAAAAVA